MAESKTFRTTEVLTADDVNRHLNPSTAEHIPYAMAAGVVEVTGPGNAPNAAAPVTFPAGRFTQPPVVTATTRSSSMIPYISSPDASGFGAGVRHYQGSNFSSTIEVHWVAVQMTPHTSEG